MGTEGMGNRVQRLAGEGLVVVSSILIAFALDAFWQDAELKRDLRLDLANVAGEIEVNRGRVEYQIDLTSRMVTALDELLARTTESSAPDLVVPDTIAWLAQITPTMDLSLGAIDALLASGRMAAVEDPNLAGRLAGLHGLVGDAVEEQVQALDIQYSLVLPLLTGMDHERIQHIGDAFWTERRVPGRALPHRGDVLHPRSQELASFLYNRRALYIVVLGELDRLLIEFDELERMIAEAD